MRGGGAKTLVGIVCALALATSTATAGADSTGGFGEGGSEGQPEEPRRFQGALRLGYSRPIGAFRFTDNHSISDGISGAVPVIIDVGFRFQSSWYLGVFGGIVPGMVGDQLQGACASASCGVLGFRFGGLAITYSNNDKNLSPWLGVGAGGEVSTIYVSDVASTVRGFDFLDVLVGVDYRPARKLGVGPFFELASGVYTHRRVSTPRYTADEVMEEWIPHAWFTVGARAVLWP